MIKHFQSQIAFDNLEVKIFHCLVDNELDTSLHLFNDNLAIPDSFSKWAHKRQKTFIAGRLAVQQAQRFFCLPITPLKIRNSGAPDWPENYCGSISHIDNHAIAVLITKNHPIQRIGIDIESTENRKLLQSFDLVAKKSEISLLEQSSISTSLGGLIIFSAKESIFKALYSLVGRYFDFLDMELISKTNNKLVFRCANDLSEVIKEGLEIQCIYEIKEGNLFTLAYQL